MRKVRNQKGFTIMELMIVIVIIGILIAIAVPAYNSFVEKARSSTCSANRRTIESAAGLYYAEVGSHTSDIADLDDYLDNVASIECPSDGAYSVSGGVAYCTEHKPAAGGGD